MARDRMRRKAEMTWRSTASFCLAFAAGAALTVNAFLGTSQPFRFGAVLAALIAVHALMRVRLWLPREFGLYVAFAAYNGLSITWSSDVTDAIPNLQQTLNFCLIFVVFGALVAFHNRRATLTGALAGFLIGALVYTRTSGFPFTYPEDFSYNTIAGMYLFGLFLTVAYGWYRRSRFLPLALALVLMLLIAATTSIKTNLGVVLGVAAAGVVYFRHALHAVGRNVVLVVLFIGLAVYLVGTNEALTERLRVGTDRVSTGANVLVARDAANGDAGLSMRENWKNLGIKGWLANPVLGNGVESFRGDFGVTSHSTPIDLLYNTGLIGTVLFYGIFASLMWRLVQRHPESRSPRGLVLGVLTCYSFISLSGTMYYDAFLAASLAISAGLIARPERTAESTVFLGAAARA
jgi:hypothetical protein